MLDTIYEIDEHNEEPKAAVVDLHFRTQNRSLAQALDDSSNYYFDMSDRWRDAFLDSLQDPIYPTPQKVEILHEVQKVDLLLGIQNILLGASQCWEQ
mmetsp:Transcript_24323/g.59551  ORF Transcript_24323/g.59551 Transcript_24323/m.59551 type:complete len:97 (-) Transcript_24323:82-372(-)